MVTIEVNGVRAEAETLKEAQRLARKEEKRQEAEYQARAADRQQAYVNAYATIGLLVCSADSCIDIVAGERLGYVYTSDGRIRLDSIYDRGCYLLPLQDDDRLDAVAMDSRGNTFAVKVRWSATCQTEWLAVGQCQLETAYQRLPAFLAERLDNLPSPQHQKEAA